MVLGQINCTTVDLVPNSTVSTVMSFDEFSKFTTGVTQITVARVRVRVTDVLVVPPLCSWSLTMQIQNFGGPTPVNEWIELGQYGAGLGANPTIDALEVRVRNACTTSPFDGIWRTFTNDLDILDIIAPLLPVLPAGGCVDNINGVGSFLTNYNEYNFDIDLRVVPFFAFNPGIYQLNLKFHLEENP